MNRKPSIRSVLSSWKLLLFVLLSLLVLFLISLQGYIVGKQSTRTIEDQYSRTIVENMNSVSINLSDYLNYIDDFARSLSNHPDLVAALESGGPGAKEETERQLSSFADYYHLRLPVNIQVFDSSQNVYAYPSVNVWEEKRLRDTVSGFPWFSSRVALDNDYLHWNVAADYHDASSSRALYVSKNIIRNNRSFGLLVIQLNGAQIERLLDRARIADANPILLFSADLTTLFHDEGLPAAFDADSPALRSLYQEVRANGGDEGTIDVRYDGMPYRLLYKQIASTPWTMVSLIPPELLHGDSVNIWRLTALMTGISVLFILVFFVILHLKVTMPVRRLSRIVNESGSGRLPPDGGYRGFKEIETLYAGIDRFLRKIQEQVQTIREGEGEKRRLELQRLQEQMRPHFWHNSLNALRFLAVLHGDPTMAEAILSLTRMLDYTLRNTDVVYSALEEEIGYAMSFVKFQEIRMMRQIRVEIEADPVLMRAAIPKFTIQPLLENAILHGFPTALGREPLIRIEARADERDLTIVIEDNGQGIGPDALRTLFDLGRRDGRRASGGLSLINLRQRFLLEYGEEYGIEIDSGPGAYTRVKLVLPCRMTEPEKAKEGMIS